MRKWRRLSYASEGKKMRRINGGLWANEKREGCDFKGRKLNRVKIQSPLCWQVWFLEGQKLPPVQDRHHQSRCRCCGRGCWLCPAALWPKFCWVAETQKGAGRQAKRHKWVVRHNGFIWLDITFWYGITDNTTEKSCVSLVLILCCFFLLTCSSFSAVGLFFGFLVRASLTKWWKLFVLLVHNWEKKKRKNELNI